MPRPRISSIIRTSISREETHTDYPLHSCRFLRRTHWHPNAANRATGDTVNLRADYVREEWELHNPGKCDMCGRAGDLEPGVIINGGAVGYVCNVCCPRDKSAWDSWEWIVNL
jgi:hypothetical protein